MEDADDKGERYFSVNSCTKCYFLSIEEYYEIDLDSWMYAAAEKNLPIIVPR
jgi:hypothetical protein